MTDNLIGKQCDKLSLTYDEQLCWLLVSSAVHDTTGRNVVSTNSTRCSIISEATHTSGKLHWR